MAPSKCHFMTLETSLLGMLVGTNGMRVDTDRIKVIETWKKPSSLTEVRSFVGLVQLFRRSIKEFSGVASPLIELTKKGSGIHKWGEACDASLKEALTTAPVLTTPAW